MKKNRRWPLTMNSAQTRNNSVDILYEFKSAVPNLSERTAIKNVEAMAEFHRLNPIKKEATWDGIMSSSDVVASKRKKAIDRGIYYSKMSPKSTLNIGTLQVSATLALWLDANDPSTITLDGSSVTNWKDKSANGYDFAQTIASNKPTYVTNAQNGKNVVRFNSASSQYLLGGTTFPIGTNNLSMFLVFKIDATTGNHSIFNKARYANAGNRIINTWESSTLRSGLTTSLAVGTHAFSDTNGKNYQLIETIIDRQAGKVYMYQTRNSKGDASFTADTTTTRNNTYNMILGGYNNYTGNFVSVIPENSSSLIPQDNYYLNGDICEIVCYTHASPFREDDRIRIENFLMSKWGMAEINKSLQPIALNHIFSNKSFLGIRK